ncbi:zinc metalloprotease HtpX [Mumia sp. zg.B53]|uniref:zinc metalloprotease HtpX n=1 Tax=unclassified Mumia TaxID=2621872 RepID=UPI001C6E23C6|nr:MULTISPECIES: zinc metalloprotease HtpX [unclassified Mumia]MBW9206302.1 zinc metalloprotease HtpX [Mumia sp. zg.B17]MBW9211404.1 zinc metalloprotease HtpX [Mumia sp. zg.B21]MBW9216577.1 zinc metalloprotease HtpX [Mumia sp. zg.B53]
MSKTRFRSDAGLTRRMGAVSLGLVVLYLAFGAVLITVMPNAALAAVVVVALAWAQWYFSDKLALASMGARVVTPEQAPELHGMIDRLCALADMPKPAVAVADTDLPNAFATGRSPSHSAVCVTTGILRRLDGEELEGVLSHELAHVANRDVSVMTVASSLGLLAGFLIRWFPFMGGGRDRNNNAALMFLVVWLASLIAYFISFLLTRALSRYRELSADRSGAYLTGKPSALASALTKITGDMGRIPSKDLRQVENMSAFFFATPAFSRDSLAGLMSSHPPVEKRLEQLAHISADLGRPL